MRPNPNYRSPNTHRIFVGNSPFDPPHVPMPSFFKMDEAHGTLVCNGFGPEPPRSRIRNDAPIPGIARIRKLTRAKPDTRLTVNLSPWDEGMIAAKGGKGRKSNPYSPIHEPDQWDDWMDGFQSN